VTPALVERVRSRLLAVDGDATPSRVAAALRDEGLVLGDDAVLDMVRRLRQELVGAGPLESFLSEPDVTDVLVNGPESIWIDRGRGLERVEARFDSESDLRRLAQRLAASAGRRLDDSVPHVDARLASGVRLHAVIPPVAVDGTLISLRIPSHHSYSLDDLAARGSMDGHVTSLLRTVVRRRLAMLISGGTGSGKTTVLSALLGEVPMNERIVIVEDSTELSPQHPHAVRLQSRVPNVEGAGQVTSRDLVRQALRMRPDRLIVGEVRGSEVVDLLAAMNTGHEGGAGTLHANSPADVPARLEALGLMAGIDRLAVHALIHAGVHVLVHVGRSRSGDRVIESLHVLRRSLDGLVATVPALERRQGTYVEGAGMADLIARLRDSP
jgi:pilus assembly protein CpaF